MSKPSTQPIDDDIANPKFNAAALDFLLIELVPLAQRITEQLQAREQALIDEYKRSKIFNSGSKDSQAGGTDGSSMNKESTAGTGEITSLGFPTTDDATREAMFWRLDGLGYRVGQGLVER